MNLWMSRWRNVFKIAVCLLAVAGMVSAVVAIAQTTSGSVVGRVADTMGESVADATVELKNAGTGSVAVTRTNSSGQYTFSVVEPGTYSVTVTSGLFAQSVNSGIVLDVAQIIRQDVTLTIGEQSTEITSSPSASPVIETDSAEISSLIDNRQIEDTPLDGRDNIYGLLALAPGVQRPTSNPLIAGSSFQSGTMSTVDGISQNDIFNARMANPVISFEGVAEFRVIGSAAPAQFGRAGSQVLIVTKGGTDQFHGGVFAFNRNKALSAAGYFPLTPRPNFNRNEFGGAVGGPVLHNKLFFFFTAEDLRLVQSTAIPTTQPTTAMLTGDLGAVALGLGKTIYDPETYNPTTGTASPFPNDANGECCQVPTQRITSLAKYFAGFFPTPNGGVTGQCFAPYSTASNCAAGSNGYTGSSPITDYIYGSPTYEKNFRWSLRGDYQLTSRDRLMARYYETNAGPYVAPDLTNSAPKFGNYSGTGTMVKNVVVNYTRVIKEHLMNEFTAGYNQEHDPREAENVNVDPGALLSGVPHAPSGHGGLPDITIYGLSGIEDPQSDFNNSQHVYQFNDNLSWIHGRHFIMAGGQYLRQRSGEGSEYPGEISYSGCFTSRSCNGGAANSSGAAENTNVANAFADFLLGDIFSSETQNTDFAYDATGASYGLFVQDMWTVSPSLTLNLGLRYEKTFPFGRTVGGLSNFYPDLNGGAGAEVYISGQEDPSILAEFPQPYILNGSSVGITYKNYYHTQNENFGPHFGFALRLNDRGTMVVRGGYALIYDYFAPFINGIGAAPPFVQSTTYQTPSGNPCPTSPPTASCPYYQSWRNENIPTLTWDSAFSDTASTGGPAQGGVERNPKQPYNQQMNLSVEWEFFRNTALRVSYVGNMASHLDDPYPLNNPVPQALPAGQSTIQSIRPYQPWGTISYTRFNTSSNFNQLQAAVRRRFSDLTLSFDFQLSKGLGLDAFNDNGVTDPQDIRLDYGNLDYYSRLYTVFSHIYELPFGSGKLFLRNSGRFLNSFVGGWRSSGVLTLYSGLPMSASFTPIGTLGNYPTGRPNVVPGVRQRVTNVSPAKAPIINAQAFCVPGVCPSDGAVWVANSSLPTGGEYSLSTPNPNTEYTYGD